MEALFKDITIKNFQCYDDLHIDFDEDRNILLGFNGVGKTTVLSAITWCLTGKNYNNETQFNYVPRKDGKDQNDLVTSVRLGLIVDGMQFDILRKVEKRIATIEVNTVRYRVSEFDTFIQDKLNITDEDLKLLMNPNYAPSMTWQELKKLIMNYVELNDDDILSNENEDFGYINDDLKSFGRDKLKETIKKNKTLFKKNLTLQDGKIEQSQKNLSEEKERLGEKEIIQKKYDELNNRIELMNSKVEEEQADIEELNKLRTKLSEKNSEVSILTNKLNEIKEDGITCKYSIDDYKKIHDELLNRSKLKQNEIDVSNNNLEVSKKKYQLELDTYNKTNNSINELNNPFEEPENCPYCNQKMPESLINQLKAKHLQERAEEYKKLVSKLENDNAAKEEAKNQYDYIVELTSKLNVELDEINNEIKNSTYLKDVEECKTRREKLLVDYSNVNSELDKSKKDIATIEEKISSMQVSRKPSEKVSKELEENRNILKAKILQFEGVELREKELKNLIDERVEIEKNIVRTEEQDKQLNRFDKIKSDIITAKLSINFKQVEFITTEKNAKGEDVDTFKLGYHGRTYDMLSGGERMLVSLDLVNGIQELKEKRIPILVDCLGELSHIPDNIETQIIGARSIEIPSVNNPNYEKIMNVYSKLAIKKGI